MPLRGFIPCNEARHSFFGGYGAGCPVRIAACSLAACICSPLNRGDRADLWKLVFLLMIIERFGLHLFS